MDIAVVGSGGWGTALALVLHENGHHVTLWSFTEEESRNLAERRENPLLKGVTLPDMTFTSDPACVRGKKLVVMASPSFAARSTALLVRPYLEPDAVLVSVAKGIEKDTSLRLTQVLHEVTGRTVAALSGPSHAEEVGRGIPTGCVAACEDIAVAHLLQDIFMNKRFRVYSSTDVIGVELGAALKNVIALCAGICDGMGFGDNTKALLMTRGLTETARLGMTMGARPETFAGLSGVGDLIVTCTSMHSRNRRAGILIGEGKSAQEAMKAVGAVVEGYYATASAMELARKTGVDMPITQAAYHTLYENASVHDMLTDLMARERKNELEDAGWK
ncbi:MAG: NAD(P)-dependent glycerol-3-phosphate dehydrogenase [Oscillospiraceae bacterium]|nr:NAD(P)-dependent glycerol-3-phosphate dehydrogenase [Oscillospiraceae bacterium]